MSKQPRNLADIAAEVIANVEEHGLQEAFGVEPLPPGRIVDPEKCQCGGGCESVLECEFWYWLRKTPQMERGARRQVQIGKYRVDCLIDCDGLPVVVELDGKEFHQDASKDRERDKLLLKSVAAVIRVPYPPVHFYPHATFAVLASWYRRFELRSTSITCLSSLEFQAELDAIPEHERRDFVEQVNLIYQVWYSCETFGVACSPKTWQGRHTAKLNSIRRVRRREAF